MSERGSTNVTRLLGLHLTPGKLRGLQRICNDNGTLTMVATDQNNSMIRMIKDSLKKKGENREPTYHEMVEAKIILADALSKHASAVLVDGYYGAWNTIASFHLPRDVGMLVRVEKSAARKSAAGAPLGEIEPGWGVGQDQAHGRRCRQAAGPVRADRAGERRAPVRPGPASLRGVPASTTFFCCWRPIAFPFGGEKKDSKSFLDRKAETVIESARQLSRFCDIYKAEFPGWLGKDSESQLQENLRQLDAASRTALGAAQRRRRFPRLQAAGGDGDEGGGQRRAGRRAFWKEYFLQDGPAARERLPAAKPSTASARSMTSSRRKAKPWFVRYGLTMDDLHSVRTAKAGTSATAAMTRPCTAPRRAKDIENAECGMKERSVIHSAFCILH